MGRGKKQHETDTNIEALRALVHTSVFLDGVTPAKCVVRYAGECDLKESDLQDGVNVEDWCI